MAAFLGNLFKGFSTSFADTQDKKKKEKLERERMAKQDAQFQQQLALQREHLAESRAARGEEREDRLSQQAFMNKILGRKEIRDALADERSGELHDFQVQQLKELFDPELASTRRKANRLDLDTKIAKSESALKMMPIEERRTFLALQNEEGDKEFKNLQRKKATLDLAQQEKMDPYFVTMAKLQQRITEAQAKKVEFDTTDERLKYEDFITRSRAKLDVIKDLANLSVSAKAYGLQAADLDARQQEDASNRYDKFFSAYMQQPGMTEEEADKRARKAVMNSAIIATAVTNKGVASKLSRTGPEHAERMRAFGTLAEQMWLGDPNSVVTLEPQFDALAREALGALKSYGDENQPSGVGPSGIPLRLEPGEEGEKPPPVKDYAEWKRRNPGRANDTAKAYDLRSGEAMQKIFSKPGLKERAQRVYDQQFIDAGEKPEPRTSEQLDGWLIQQLNARKDITGDPATRADKLLREMGSSGGRPSSKAEPQGGTTPSGFEFAGASQSRMGETGPQEGDIRQSGA